MPSPTTIAVLLARFGGATAEMLDRVLTPYRLRLSKIDIAENGKEAEFEAEIPADVWTTFEEGTTGKVVPKNHVERNAPWREVVKARIRETKTHSVVGELYFAPVRVKAALKEVKVGDYLEIDPFGVTSKVESALCEAALYQVATAAGFAVTRMPENVAKHVGTQNYYDFRLERDSLTYRVELKSLWGTDTTKARLIHTVSKEGGGGKNSKRDDKQVWDTSSCRFQDQDVFAVSMWLRTGRVTDFAFALSAPENKHRDWGLPEVPKHPHHVTQNPPISAPPSGPWTMDLNEACRRFDKFAKRHTSKHRG
jgi:hypothetical protein